MPDASTNDALKTTLEIPFKGETFEFRIPTVLDDIKVGSRIREILRKADPESMGQVAGLDWATFNKLEACAGFELLLKSSSAKWPWTENAQKQVIVDSTLFPAEHNEDITAIYQGFSEALRRFRNDRAVDERPAGT